MNRFTYALAVFLLCPAVTFAQLNVLASGGFSTPYRELLPAYEKSARVSVATTFGASQGSSPTTIPARLRSGAVADVVIMSEEGLDELVAESRVVPGSIVKLARTPLGMAIRTGGVRPDISTVDGFKQAVLRAKQINVVSTTGHYLTAKLFPALGIADEVSRKLNGDNRDSLQKTQVDMVLRPVSEIVDLPGFDFVGPVPKEIQYSSVFSAAIVNGAVHVEEAKRLIAFLASEEARPVIRRSGMEPLSP